jgi:hypothetical protein
MGSKPSVEIGGVLSGLVDSRTRERRRGSVNAICVGGAVEM